MARLRRPLLVGFTALLIAWAGALVYLRLERSDGQSASTSNQLAQSSPNAGPFRGSKLPEGIVGRPAPDFRLSDARGRRVDTRRLAGQPYLVTFLYTNCPPGDTCPTIAAELRQALERLGPRADDLTVLAVSVEPKGDTPAAARRWLRRYRLPDNFRFLVGSRRELEPVWESYYVGSQDATSEQSRHTSNIWLIDARGRWRTKFSAGVPVPPADIAHDLGVLLDEAERS
jgi:protein SCO1/2